MKDLTPVFSTVESSNSSILRVVWICFDADQFCAIVYESDRTRSLLLAAEWFLVRRYVERGNDDLDEALEVLVGVKAKSKGVANIE